MMRNGLSCRPASSKWASTVRRISMTMIRNSTPLTAVVTRWANSAWWPKKSWTDTYSTTAPTTTRNVATP